MGIKIASYQVEIKPSSSWTTVAAGHVLSVRGGIKFSGNGEFPIAFGDSTDVSCSVELREAALASVPDRMPIRITFTMDAGSAMAFNGVVIKASRTYRKRVWSLECEGAKTLVSTTRAYSPIFERRVAATKTTASSIEDPSDALYVGGPVNWGLWQAGGRPYEQAGSYPTAAFYYSCDQALLAPDFAWLAGDDTWGELQKLAEAAGGQTYQGGDGVVRYKQPLAFASGGAGSYTFTPSDYADIAEESSTRAQVATKVVCPFVPRSVRATQQIAEDTTVRQVQPSASVTFEIETEQPCTHLETSAGLLRLHSISTTSLKTEAINVTYLDGRTVVQGAGGYTHSVTTSAKRFTVTITNDGSLPFYVNKVTLRGRPIVAGTPGSVSSGSGTTVRNVKDNYFIQRRGHAQRIADMTLAFASVSRPVYRLSGSAYDPDRYVGEAVGLTAPAWSLSDAPCFITEIQHDKTGKLATYTLVSTSGLPAGGDYYLVGATDYSGQTRKLTW